MKRSINILYVGVKIRGLIELLKNIYGFNVSVTYDQTTAFLYLEKSFNGENPIPNIIVCESGNKVSNEFSVLLKVRNRINDLKLIPIMIISNGKNRSMRFVAEMLEADDFFEFPIVMSDLEEKIRGLVKINHRYRIKDKEEPNDYRKLFLNSYKTPLLKRIFDIIFSSILLIVFIPFGILISFAIKIESRGPIFYSSKRVGPGYRIFNFFKFRSMKLNSAAKLENLRDQNHYITKPEESNQKINESKCALITDDRMVDENTYIDVVQADETNSFLKIKNDPRVTRVGKFLRNTSLDEIPQFFNVLIGDMSIVGNRPLPLYEAEKLTTDEDALRFMAPGGITGLWQVNERGTSKNGTSNRKKYDIEYAQKNSFWMDIKILMKTPFAAFQRESV